jgi:broad specificity phosphatase PhoE
VELSSHSKFLLQSSSESSLPGISIILTGKHGLYYFHEISHCPPWRDSRKFRRRHPGPITRPLEKFDQVWSSDLQRCVDTANFLLEYHPGLKLQVAPDLREIKYGNLQGKKATDIEWDEIESADLNQKYPGGESNMEMAGRVLGFLNELLAKFPDQSILIVTHGGPMRVIRAAHDKLPLEQIFNRDIVNTAIFDFDLKTPLEIRLSK